MTTASSTSHPTVTARSGAEQHHYLIRGGIAGRERLRLLARVFAPTTDALFDRLDIQPGMTVLDAGCGGGDVTLELARRVGPAGHVTGTDIDHVKLDLARAEAVQTGVANVTFKDGDLVAGAADATYDLVYARFLLTHLIDPAAALTRFIRLLRPGGRIVVEDVDFAGQFAFPPSPAFERSITLFTEAAKRRGGDPMIGPRIPSLLRGAGFTRLGVNVVQPAGLDGEVKLVTPLTIENIADTVLAEGIATQAELDATIAAHYAIADDPEILVSLPRVVQAWGQRARD